jgi:hypothetical protein
VVHETNCSRRDRVALISGSKPLAERQRSALIALTITGAIAFALGCAGRQVKPTPAHPSSAAVSEHASPAPTPAVAGVMTPEATPASEVAANPAFGEPTPTPVPGSLAGRAVRATPHFIASVALSPFRFLWNAAKENYSDDDTSTGAVVANPSAHEIRFANPSSTPKPLAGKAEDALVTTYDYGERTIFFPWRILDDAIGMIFSPF